MVVRLRRDQGKEIAYAGYEGNKDGGRERVTGLGSVLVQGDDCRSEVGCTQGERGGLDQVSGSVNSGFMGMDGSPGAEHSSVGGKAGVYGGLRGSWGSC